MDGRHYSGQGQVPWSLWVGKSQGHQKGPPRGCALSASMLSPACLTAHHIFVFFFQRLHLAPRFRAFSDITVSVVEGSETVGHHPETLRVESLIFSLPFSLPIDRITGLGQRAPCRWGYTTYCCQSCGTKWRTGARPTLNYLFTCLLFLEGGGCLNCPCKCFVHWEVPPAI